MADSKSKAPAGSAAGEKAKPTDQFQLFIQKSVAGIIRPDYKALIDAIKLNLTTPVNSAGFDAPFKTPKAACNVDDPEPACYQLDLDLATAQGALDQAVAAAKLAYAQELKSWHEACDTYDEAIASAQDALKAATSAAEAAYKDMKKHDASGVRSDVRAADFIATGNEAIAAAVVAQQAAVSAAGATLAGEAGGLISAYATLLAALTAAYAQNAQAQYAAELTFWQSIEQA